MVGHRADRRAERSLRNAEAARFARIRSMTNLGRTRRLRRRKRMAESAANAAFRAAQVNRQVGRKEAIVGVSRRRLVSTGERPFARTAQALAGPRRTDSQLPAGASARTRLASGAL